MKNEMTTGKYTLLLADDHKIFRQGMRRLIEDKPEFKVVGEVNDGSELLKRLQTLNPHMILLDISMPEVGGIDATNVIRKIYPDIKVLILTMHKKKEYMYHAISAGAQGYLLKEDSDIELFAAIKAIRNGEIYVSRHMVGDMAKDISDVISGKSNLKPLTNRENEILRLIAKGKLNREIADHLDISIRTVENHRANIMRKLGLKKTTELVKYAIQHGFVDLAF